MILELHGPRNISFMAHKWSGTNLILLEGRDSLKFLKDYRITLGSKRSSKRMLTTILGEENRCAAGTKRGQGPCLLHKKLPLSLPLLNSCGCLKEGTIHMLESFP